MTEKWYDRFKARVSDFETLERYCSFEKVESLHDAPEMYWLGMLEAIAYLYVKPRVKDVYKGDFYGDLTYYFLYKFCQAYGDEIVGIWPLPTENVDVYVVICYCVVPFPLAIRLEEEEIEIFGDRAREVLAWPAGSSVFRHMEWVRKCDPATLYTDEEQVKKMLELLMRHEELL